MFPRDRYCVLRVLTRSFAREYFHGKLAGYRADWVRRNRDKRRKLGCDNLGELDDDTLVSLLGELKGARTPTRGISRRKLLKIMIKDIRSRIAALSCRKMKDLDLHVMLKSLYIKEFSATFWSELASILFPDRFFVIDKSLFEAIDFLLKRGLIPAERFPVLASKHWGVLWIGLDEYIAGRSGGEDEVRRLIGELKSVVDTILGYLREIEPTADYLDADSFLRFIHMAMGGTVRDDYTKEVEVTFGKLPGVVLNYWLEQAKKECESPTSQRGWTKGW